MDTLFDRVHPDRDAPVPAPTPRPRRLPTGPARRPAPRTRQRAEAERATAIRPGHDATSVVALRLEPLPLWLAERDDPTLARVPMVAADEGRVLHANPSARRHGITHGMRLDGALLRAPNLHVAGAREPDLDQAWREVLRELTVWTPWLAALRRGLALLRLTPDEATALAAAFRGRVGVATDRHSAELASASVAAGAIRVVTEGDEDAFLARLPLRFLRALGLGAGDLTRLQWLGLQHVGDLARWSEPQLRGYLGAAAAPLLPYLHGPRDTRVPLWAAPAQLRRELRFDTPLDEPWQLDPAIDRLATTLEEALAGRGGTRLTVAVEVEGGSRHVTRIAKRPLTSAAVIARQAHAALDEGGLAADAAQRGGIEALTLTLDEPRRLSAQEGLWATRTQRVRALESIGERFPRALVRAEWGDPYAPASDQAWDWRPLDATTAGSASPSGDDPHGPVPLGIAEGVAVVRPTVRDVSEHLVVLPHPPSIRPSPSQRPQIWPAGIADAA